LIATPDRNHVEPALAALEKGYHVLLEKPMALDEDACEPLVEASERA
jgi:predicted dehydrogenase